MKKTILDDPFIVYGQRRIKMPSTERDRVRRGVLTYYRSLHENVAERPGIASAFRSFFYGPMTYSKFITYALSFFVLSAGTYAGVAPDAFARNMAEVKTSVKTAVDSSLHVFNPGKASTKIATDTDIDADAKVNTGTDAAIHAETDTRARTQIDLSDTYIRDIKEKSDADAGSDVSTRTHTSTATSVSVDAGVKGDADIKGILPVNTSDGVDGAANSSASANTDAKVELKMDIEDVAAAAATSTSAIQLDVIPDGHESQDSDNLPVLNFEATTSVSSSVSTVVNSLFH